MGREQCPQSNIGTDSWVETAAKLGIDLGWLAKNKIQSASSLEELDLPRQKRIVATVDDFLTNPDEHLEQFLSDNLYIVILPANKEKGRLRRKTSTRKEALEFIQTVPHDEYKYLTICEDMPVVYTGALTISSNETIYAEVAESNVINDVSHGRVKIEGSMRNNPYTGIMKYTTNDEKLRKLLWETLQCIPHEVSENSRIGRGAKYHPGYYEFFWSLINNENNLRLIFRDYQGAEDFQVP